MHSTQRLGGFQEEIQLGVLHRLEQSPDLSRRILVKELAISLGSINFRFQALVEKCWIKVHNFSQSNLIVLYANLLTPAGISEKSKLTAEFLKRKTIKY